MKRSSQSHLNSVAKYAATCGRYRDGKRLERFTQSDDFLVNMSGMNIEDRARAMRAVNEAAAACKAQLDALKPLPPACSKRVKHTPELIAKIRRLAPVFLNDKEFAREVGMSLEAARAARYKFVGPKSKIVATTRGALPMAPNLLTGAKNSDLRAHAS